jgi:hypothetical protein
MEETTAIDLKDAHGALRTQFTSVRRCWAAARLGLYRLNAAVQLSATVIGETFSVAVVIKKRSPSAVTA